MNIAQNHIKIAEYFALQSTEVIIFLQSQNTFQRCGLK